MKLSNFLKFNAILLIGLGIAFALYGPLMINLYGILKTDSSAVAYWHITSFARMLGAALFGYGFTLWAIKRVPDQEGTSPTTVRGIILALVLANIVGLIVAITQQISIWGTITGWITVGVFLVLVIGYLYFLFSYNRE